MRDRVTAADVEQAVALALAAFGPAVDVTGGLGTPWAPPAGLCRRVLHRLFPDAPADSEPWPTLLWATGRGDLPGHPAVTSWGWYPGPASG